MRATSSDENIPVRWQEGRIIVKPTGANLAADPVLAGLLEKARRGNAFASFAAVLPG